LALTHRSVSNEAGHHANNERLEFLGDAILGAVTADLLYERLPDKPEGELAKIKAVVVSEDTLSGVARSIQLDTVLLLGKGEELSGGRNKNAILADAMEAVIGAYYLDSGFKCAFGFVKSLILPEIVKVLENRHHRDYKSLLQEYCQRKYRRYPSYRVSNRSGPEHERMYWIEVEFGGQVYGPGAGRNKKAAEQEAARLAWEAVSPQ
jgi:ribonuclease-3